MRALCNFGSSRLLAEVEPIRVVRHPANCLQPGHSEDEPESRCEVVIALDLANVWDAL